MQLVQDVYALKFPKEELYGLQSQIRRAATSIPMLISEGCGRDTDKDFKHYLIQARGSAKEISTALEISKRLNYIDYQTHLKLSDNADAIGKMLTNLIKKVGGGGKDEKSDF